jgi:hypothetical protein
MLAGEGVRADARQEDVAAPLHHRARERNRRAGVADPRHRPGCARAPVHDRCIELGRSLPRQRRAAPGVEVRIVLEHAHRRFDRIGRRTAPRQHRRARIQRRGEPGAGARLDLAREPPALEPPGAAMDHQGPAHGRSP